MREPWRVSLHGGHSGSFCLHARDRLHDILEAACRVGYRTFGVTEHAPRSEVRFVFPEEIEAGYDTDRLHDDFEAYSIELERLCEQFSERLEVLRGFEGEVVPSREYAREMLDLRKRFGFDYLVGSVHFVDEVVIDGPTEEFERAVALQGGLEAMAVRYYRIVAEMVESLRPEVVGHLDLPRRHAPGNRTLECEAVRSAAGEALEVIRRNGSILDLNTAGIRKGLEGPYPDSWLACLAHEMGIGFCFGDDSHSAAEVGAGIDESRQYLLGLGIDRVTVLTRDRGEIIQQIVSLL